MTIFNMSTTKRHIDLINEFVVQSGIMRRIDKINLKTYQEEAALVHYGHRRKDPFILSLVDIDKLESLDLINHLEYTQPDFILFNKNKYIWNERETRLAGCPDLVVEIWSESNTQIDREEKFLIYSHSNDKTEHWYIEQDSNTVECYLGGTRLENQTLTKQLVTRTGLEFDLTHLAV